MTYYDHGPWPVHVIISPYITYIERLGFKVFQTFLVRLVGELESQDGTCPSIKFSATGDGHITKMSFAPANSTTTLTT